MELMPAVSLSAAASVSVISAIQLSEHIMKLCMVYMRDANGAHNDILTLLNAVSDLQDTLDDVHKKLENDDRKALPTSSQLFINTTDCHADLEALKVRLDPVTTQNPMKLLGTRALTWPLEPREAEEVTQSLGKHRSSLLSSLKDVNTSDSVHRRDVIKKSIRKDLAQSVKGSKGSKALKAPRTKDQKGTQVTRQLPKTQSSIGQREPTDIDRIDILSPDHSAHNEETAASSSDASEDISVPETVKNLFSKMRGRNRSPGAATGAGIYHSDTVKQLSPNPNTDQSDNNPSKPAADGTLGVPRRMGRVSPSSSDRKHSGFRRGSSNEPIIRRSKDEVRESKLGHDLDSMRGSAAFDPVSPLSPLPNQGDGSRKVGDLSELEAPTSMFKGKEACDTATTETTTTTTVMTSQGTDIDAEPAEQENEEKMTEAPSRASIVTVERIIPEPQHSPTDKYWNREPMPQSWPLVDDNSLMQDRSGAWRQDARTIISPDLAWPLIDTKPFMRESPRVEVQDAQPVASPEWAWPVFDNDYSVPEDSGPWGHDTQIIAFPVGVWPPVDDKPFMQELSGAWVQDARTMVSADWEWLFFDKKGPVQEIFETTEQDKQTTVTPSGVWPSVELTQPGILVQDEQTMDSPDNMSHLEMKPKHGLQSQLQTQPAEPAEPAEQAEPTEPADIGSGPLQKSSIDTLGEVEVDEQPACQEFLGFIDEIIEDSPAVRNPDGTPDPNITQDRELNDAAESEHLETSPNDPIQTLENNDGLEEIATKSIETEERARLPSRWPRFMNIRASPAAGTTSNNSAAFGLWAYLVAIFTVYITYQYYVWKEST